MKTTHHSFRGYLALLMVSSSASLFSLAVAQTAPTPSDTGATPILSRLSEASVLALTGTNGNPASLGFVVGNNDGSSTPGTANFLVRGVGPTLAQFGVPDAIQAPVLSCTDLSGASVASTDGWNSGDPVASANLAFAFATVGAFSLPPDSGDIAYMSGFNTGDSYSLQLASATSTAGMVLGELYDLDAASAPCSLINFSGQAQVGTGTDILTAGFVVSGDNPLTLLVRAVGPGLTQFGTTGVLPNPQVSIYDSNGNLVAQNVGWNDDATLAATFGQVGAFALPAGSTDSAVVVTLPAGAYSAEVTDANGATGQALVEVYVVQ